jgi:hypothetical protein
MKKYIVYVISLIVALHTHGIHADMPTLQGHSFFYARSQSVNAAREIAGWLPHIHRSDMMDENYSSFVTTGAYNHSLHGNRIAEALFGTDELFISGSTTTNRGVNDILADYFGLSPDFESTVSVEPTIQSAILAFSAFFGLNKWCRGLYLQIHAPIAWTKWNLGLEETIFEGASNIPFPANYMDVNATPPGAQSFVQALQGCTTFGQMQEPLQFGKVCGSQVKKSVSDIQIALGWDFLLSEYGFAGFNIRCAAPAGNRSKSVFLLEPIVGNGHHWELGGGFAGRGLIWEKDGEQELSFFGTINMTHLFASKQRRSFDLGQDICQVFPDPQECPCDEKQICHVMPRHDLLGSRYMLVKEFDENGNYTGNLAPLINKTTLDCNVRINLQVDLVLMFDYTYCGFVFDVGYNGWIRSREIISLGDKCFPECTFAVDTLGLKGIQNVTFDSGVLSNATQSNATLFGNYLSDRVVVADPNPPVFIKPFDINIDSPASPLAITHKFFMYFGWTDERDCWCVITPFFGFGGEVEFEGINTRNAVEPLKTTMSQWGVWAKFGFDY